MMGSVCHVHILDLKVNCIQPQKRSSARRREERADRGRNRTGGGREEEKDRYQLSIDALKTAFLLGFP
jgi:hypothetical protein